LPEEGTKKSSKTPFYAGIERGGRAIIGTVEYPFPPVGIVGAADGKNRRAFLCILPKVLA